MRRYLLVEGARDSTFYAALVRVLGYKHIDVMPPHEFGKRPGKVHALILLSIIAQQLGDGSVEKLGVVVDADHASLGSGFGATFEKVAGILRGHGYVAPNMVARSVAGLIFSHPEGLPEIGVWIMPDNGSDGMLEDFVRQSVEEADQAALLSAAVTVVGKLDKPLFDRKRHLSKAEVATWLAWQKIPGKGIESAAGDGLIKLNAPLVSEFNAWLKRTF